MIECKDIDYILAIAKHGSISKAAEELYITQPALTKYLRSLEERLGVELFFRERRPLTLTPIGELYVNYSKDIAILKNDLENELSRFKNEDYQELRVGFSCTEIRPYIYPVVRKMRKSDPNVEITLIELSSQEIENRLEVNQLDLGFITMPKHNPGIEASIILEEDVLLGIPAGHQLAALGAASHSKDYPLIDLKYFSHDPFVLRGSGTRFSELSRHLFSDCGYTPNVAVTARNNFSAIEFAEVWGMCVLTTRSFISNLHDPDSMRFFIVGPNPRKLSIGVANNRDAPLSLAMNKLIARIRDEIALSK